MQLESELALSLEVYMCWIITKNDSRK